MSDTTAFGDNPFRALKSDRFPDRKKTGTASTDVVRRSYHRRHGSTASGIAAEDGVSKEDRELFLAAIRPRTSQTDDGGCFSLSEMGVMPLTDGVQKRQKRRGDRNRGHDNPSPNIHEPKSLTPGAPVGKARSATPAKAEYTAFSTQGEGMADADMSDAADFLLAMRTVRPLATRGRDVNTPPPPVTPPPHGELGMQDVMEGRLEFALSFTDEYLEGHVVGLDEMTMNKLRSGALSPEAHLDLHGLNAMQAFEALRNFFRGSWYKGLRTVLVVPGRGRNSPDGVGVLREKMQNWLTQEPFKRVVLAFCTAQPHDGGPGSVYVLLRKYRKKGRVCWERLPADADLY